MVVQWHCFQCKEPVEEVRAQVEYLEVQRPVEAIRCPGCGEIYLLEEAVVNLVNKIEKALEEK